MQELKVFDVGLGQYCEDGSPCVVAFDADQNPRVLNEKVYLKSEADKVIAELEDKCQMHDFFWEGCGFAKRGFKNTIAVSESFDKLEAENAQLKKQVHDCAQGLYVMQTRAENEARRHKYKRCLAMARWCASRSASWCFDPADDELHKSDFYDKWKLRWRKLAEKFKPSNTTAQQGKG